MSERPAPTKDEVVRALRQAVADYGPDWVDPNAEGAGCTNIYTHNGEVRRCIAAQALHNLGVSDDRLDGQGDVLSTYHALRWLDFHGEPSGDRAAFDALAAAQAEQEFGATWGTALASALRVIGIDSHPDVS